MKGGVYRILTLDFVETADSRSGAEVSAEGHGSVFSWFIIGLKSIALHIASTACCRGGGGTVHRSCGNGAPFPGFRCTVFKVSVHRFF